MSDTKCGFVAIIGEPNAGKSTLMNALVGQKITIVSPKVQTTRFNVRGMLTRENTQLIFIDTPGIFNAPKKFEQAMVKSAWAGAGDADAVLLIIDVRKGITESLEPVLEQLSKFKKKPVFVALNKIDKIPKEALFALAETIAAKGNFAGIFMISALKEQGLEKLTADLANVMPAGPFLYPEDVTSDIQMRMLAAEITREKLFFMLGQELPYAAFVETESWEEKEGITVVSQIIYVQREAHKKMVIGEKGAMIKRIGSSARRELEKMIEGKMHLSLFVKVKENWKEDREAYRLMGLEF